MQLVIAVLLGIMTLGVALLPGGAAHPPLSQAAGSGAGLAAALHLGPPAAQTIWRDVAEGSFASLGQRDIRPTQYRTLASDPAALTAALAAAPLERPGVANGALLALPLPQGGYGRFWIRESPILAPALAARFPAIRTYTAQGIDDPSASGRLDSTPAGLHALIQTTAGSLYIDPYSRGDSAHYVAYYGANYPAPPGLRDLQAPRRGGPLFDATAPHPPSGAVLRTYRLAVAGTSQYTAFQGGTVALALAAITTAVNRIDSVFEREVAVRMTLIANETSIIYLPGSTDPYTNDDPSAMLGQNQANLDQVIGAANYDIGHVFAAARGGGVAYVGVVCNATYKAQGATASTQPVGDPYAIGLVAHEMGHQFGGDHTYNAAGPGSCTQGRGSTSAYEPGSGSTIMGYAGICGESNLQDGTDPYFLNSSYDQIVSYTTGDGGACGVQSPTGNQAPVVNAGLNYTIPGNTPFQLTGSATDPNGDALTYIWEEHDLGTESPPNTDDGSRPLFRSYLPGASPIRLLPRLENILAGNTTALGETLPSTNRTLNFRLVARDNRAGGGGVDYGTAAIAVTTAAGPFLVTAPGADTWAPGSQQTVAWNVANTNQAPINCAQVNILLSLDRGQTFPTSLANNVPNSGTQVITVPSGPTTQGRVKVACATNIFFDLSHADLTITAGGPNPPGTVAPTVTPSPVPSATPTGPVETPTATETPCVPSFSDVPPAAFFYPFVQYLYCNGSISGYADGTFRPYNPTTRAQMVKIVTVSLGLGYEPPPAGDYTFADVPPSNPYFSFVENASANGVVSGYTCGGPGEPCDPQQRPYFRPGAPVTRGQLAKIIVEAAAWPTVATSSQAFSDVPLSNPFLPYINTLYCRYTISGYPCGGAGEPCDPAHRPYFRTGSNANREQIAKIVYLAAQDPEPCVGP